MLKKGLLVTAILAASSSLAFANAAYVGGGLGVGGYYSQTGVIANLFAGYGLNVGPAQRFYLAGELNGSVAHYNSYKTIYGYGLSVIPGVVITQSVMLYGRAGLNADYPYQTMKYSRYGAHLGLGLQVGIDRNWAMRVEYTRLITPDTGNYNLALLYKFN